MMRKPSPLFFIACSLTLSLIALVPVVSAATGNPGDPCTTSVAGVDKPGVFGSDGHICIATPDTSAEASASGETAETDPAKKTPVKASVPNIPSESWAVPVINMLMQVFAWLLGVAAITLDNAVYYTVVTMGSVVNRLSAIGVSWRILRDIGNIVLIFGFLAIGISIILDTERLGYGKKMLPTLLFVAVTLNFSLFVAEGVIDVSNLFATQFYTQINGGSPASPKGYSDIASEGISNKIMGQLGLQTIYNAGQVQPEVLKANNNILIGFMGIGLFLVTAFVFFSLAFILIFRFVALVLLIVSSPVGFAGLAVPKLETVAHRWWSELINQAITAPVLLLLLYVALAVITDVNFLSGFGTTNDGWTNFVNQQNLTSFAGTILSFIVAMGLLLSVTVTAKKIGAAGSDRAMKWAGKASFGLTAAAGRTTIGWGSNRLATMARKSALGRIPLVGTGITRGLDRVASSSFDVRSTNALKIPGYEIDAGEAAKGGYKAELKARTESRVKYAKDLKGKITETEKGELENAQKAYKRAVDAGNTAEANRQKAIVDRLEERTDSAAQRKYAKALNLWRKPDGWLNKLNFAANTEAAAKIRKEAKKTSEDKRFDDLAAAFARSGGGTH